MKDIVTYAAGQFDEVLAALEQNGAAYVQLSKDATTDLSALLRDMTAFLDRQPVSESDADPQTMFPARLATEPEMPARKVVQLYAERRPGCPNVRRLLGEDLWANFFLTLIETERWAQDLMAAAANRYGFNAALYRQLRRIDEWSLNAIQYVSIPPNGDGRMLVYGGAVLQKFTCGKITAARHHVKQKSPHNRNVILYYVDPPRDLLLPDGRTVAEFMERKLRKIGQI